MEFAAFIDENYKKNEFIAKMNISPNRKFVKTYHYNVASLSDNISSPEVDSYMSMNPIRWIDKKIRRDKEHVSALRWLYVDLDIYNSSYCELSKEQILWNLEEDYFGLKIPHPNYVIDSGRGMYLLWRIDEHINAYPRWEKVQRYLSDTLLEFGADTAVVSDSARVLRVLGSVNSKSGTIVNIMRSYTQRKYTLYWIMSNYASQLLNNKNNNDLHKCNKPDKKKNDKVIFFSTPYTLLNARLSDLERLLVLHRDREDSKRECILFLYRYWTLCVTDDVELALQRTLALNARIKHSLSEYEVINATKSAEKYYKEDRRCFTNSWIIRFLEISEFEMKELQSIISPGEKLQRKSARNRKTYLAKLCAAGKSTKDVQIKKRRASIYELICSGKSCEEICELLNISRRTFYNDKKVISNMSQDELDLLVYQEKVIEINDKTEPEKDSNIACDTESAKNSALVLRGRSPMFFTEEETQHIILLQADLYEIDSGGELSENIRSG